MLKTFATDSRSAAGGVLAAKRFLGKALRRSRDWKPHVVNIDKNPAYGEAIAELKKEGLLPFSTTGRRVTTAS
jgi:transposase-like protein